MAAREAEDMRRLLLRNVHGNPFARSQIHISRNFLCKIKALLRSAHCYARRPPGEGFSPRVLAGRTLIAILRICAVDGAGSDVDPEVAREEPTAAPWGADAYSLPPVMFHIEFPLIGFCIEVRLPLRGI